MNIRTSQKVIKLLIGKMFHSILTNLRILKISNMHKQILNIDYYPICN